MHSPLIANIIVVIFIIAILASLGVGLFYLLVDQKNGNNTYKALAWRIGLSMLLFLGLLLAIYLGIITPAPPPL